MPLPAWYVPSSCMAPPHHAFPGRLVVGVAEGDSHCITLILADAQLQLLNNSIHGCPCLSVGGAGGNGLGLGRSPRIFGSLKRATLWGEQVSGSSSSLAIYRWQRQTFSQLALLSSFRRAGCDSALVMGRTRLLHRATLKTSMRDSSSSGWPAGPQQDCPVSSLGRSAPSPASG